MTDEERWAAYLAMATALKAAASPDIDATGIVGRFITVLAVRLAKFWGKHKATLIPHLTTAAIAALEALVSELPAIKDLNPPGPR